MKSRLALISLALCTLLAPSCTKRIYETNDPVVVTINVSQGQWAYTNTDNNNYFYATVNMPEITDGVFNYGMVKMYRTYDFGTNNAVQTELPFIRLNEWYSEEDGYWYNYVETVDYEFSPGTLTIYYTASDFDYELDDTFIPSAMTFRCVIME